MNDIRVTDHVLDRLLDRFGLSADYACSWISSLRLSGNDGKVGHFLPDGRKVLLVVMNGAVITATPTRSGERKRRRRQAKMNKKREEMKKDQ